LLEPLPASPEAFRWLTMYYAEHGAAGTDETVWRTLRGPSRPLTYWAMRRIFQRANEMLGTNWTLHDCRHTTAARLASILGGLAGGAIGQRRKDQKARERKRAFASGVDVRIPAAVRHFGQTAWYHGDIVLTKSSAVWQAPGGSALTIDFTPPVEAFRVRKVTFKESLDIDVACRIVMCRRGDQQFEVAVPLADLQMVGMVLPLPAR
jgi:hypothetical protein